MKTRFIIRDRNGSIIYHNLTKHSKLDGFGWEPGNGFLLWDDIEREGWTVETQEIHAHIKRMKGTA